MEELLAYAFLSLYGIVSENEYSEKLDTLFLANPENEDLLNLEEETDIINTIRYIRTHIDYGSYNHECFGKILMAKIKVYYKQCPDIKKFSEAMYSLWENLPPILQDEEPFYTLSYADDPLSWSDEEQTRKIYESIFNYYQ